MTRKTILRARAKWLTLAPAPNAKSTISPLRDMYDHFVDVNKMVTIKAKDFANEITNFTIKRDDLRTEEGITGEHVKNNREVRNLLVKRNIKPEELPPAEDVKKVERRLISEQKKLLGRPEPLEPTE
jgi:hypothetical protein